MEQEAVKAPVRTHGSKDPSKRKKVDPVVLQREDELADLGGISLKLLWKDS
jgi:hypothetical protein